MIHTAAVEIGTPALSSSFGFKGICMLSWKKKKLVLRKEEEVKQEVGGQGFVSLFFFLDDVSVGFILLSDKLSPTTPGTKT